MWRWLRHQSDESIAFDVLIASNSVLMMIVAFQVMVNDIVTYTTWAIDYDYDGCHCVLPDAELMICVTNSNKFSSNCPCDKQNRYEQCEFILV